MLEALGIFAAIFIGVELGGDDGDIEDHDEAQAMLVAAGWQYDIWLDRYVKTHV
jgi:hypothetical protein